MASDLKQRKAFKFLREHLHSQEPFTKEDLSNFTGWTKPGTLGLIRFSGRFRYAGRSSSCSRAFLKKTTGVGAVGK